MAKLHARITWRVLAACGAVVLLVGGGAAVAASRSSAPTAYRTAVVGRHEVAHELTGVATIEPVTQASVAFPLAGTVSTVGVRIGDSVTTGQTLATLDTASPRATLLQAQAALDSAKLNLAQALAGKPVIGSGTGSVAGGSNGRSSSAAATTASVSSVEGSPSYVLVSTGPTTSTPRRPARTPTTSPTGSTAGRTADADLQKAQQAVLDAQKQVDLDLARSQQALDASTRACAAVTDPAPSTTTTTTTIPPTTTSSTTTSTTAPVSNPTATNGAAACRAALQAGLDAQHVVNADEAALAKASTALDDLLAKRANTASPTTTPQAGGATGSTHSGQQSGLGGPPTSGSGSGRSGTTAGSAPTGRSGSSSNGASGAGSTQSATTTLPTAKELIAYQKAVDAATAKVAVAFQGVAQASIVSPINGTVAAVNLAPGDHVNAASATAAVIVVGKGGFEATTTVTVDDLDVLEVGQPARVVPDGSDTTVTGKVVSIGVAADTSGTTATYPVAIGFSGESPALRNGATASVSITTGQVARALAVPTSAITSSGGRKVVTVLTGGKTTVAPVQVGVTGDTWTEITSGVKSGQTVVLADLDSPLPGSATNGSSSATQTGFPAGGFGGGFGGGGPRTRSGAGG